MKYVLQLILVIIATFGFVLVPTPSFAQGVQHFEWTTIPPDGEPIYDYNNCTGEVVAWLVDIRENYQEVETPSGQGHFIDHWVFEGTVVGEDTGFVWTTKGIVHVVGIYSLENSLTGGEAILERAPLKPMSSGAPRIKLDVQIITRFNAAGDQVVDRLNYTYHCVGG